MNSAPEHSPQSVTITQDLVREQMKNIYIFLSALHSVLNHLLIAPKAEK